MTELHVTARFRIQAGQTEVAKPILRQLQERTRQEPGNLAYAYYVSDSDPQVFTSIEAWRDAAAEAAHWQTEHLKAALEKLGPLMDGQAQVDKYSPIV